MEDLSTLLESAAAGDREAFDRAYSLVYDELHELARSQRRRWNGDETLNTTALVHEAYLRLSGWTGAAWKGRGHFLAVAARAMRQLLVNRAERQRAAKRGGGRSHADVAERVAAAPTVPPETAEEVLALHEALSRLEEIDERRSRVVECRYFAGLTIDETAGAVGVSTATVKRDLRFAQAWLYREMTGGPPRSAAGRPERGARPGRSGR